MVKETALITGASSGIGLELARLFARDGSDLVLVARSEEKLRELARALSAEHGVGVHVMPEDLSRPEASRDLVEALGRQGITVDVLVNNAGIGARGRMAELDVDRQLRTMQVNVVALTHLTRLLLPRMIERGRGGVLNVASTAAFQPGPYMAVYYATKAYVLSLSEALAEEVRGSGIKVTCLCPGPTRTGFAAEANMEDTLLMRYVAMDVAGVARAGYQGFRAGRSLVVTGLHNRLGASAVRFIPRALARKSVAFLQALNETRGTR